MLCEIRGRRVRLHFSQLSFASFAAALVLASPPRADLVITVDKSAQEMTIADDGTVLYTWPVSTGMVDYDTPMGEFKPFRMERDHFSREWDDAPMPYSIFFTQDGHAIHGSYDVKHLGRPASHGCVRLSHPHAVTLFRLVQQEGMSNTRVVLIGEIPDAESHRYDKSTTSEIGSLYPTTPLQLTLNSNALAQDTVADCDKYAASDTDPDAKAPGVSLEKVNPAAAVPACAAAVREFPNNPRLLFQLGRAYRAASDFNSAVEYYRKAAEQNYAAAQNSLGYAYANGQGIPADDRQAVAWYRKAAEQGLAVAQNNLGVMYWNGQGVPKDDQQAAAWFRKAAEQGLASAQSNLMRLTAQPGEVQTPQQSPPTPQLTTSTLQLTNFSIQQSQLFGGYAVGSITNISKFRCSLVVVTFNLFDRNGALIDSTLDTVSNLDPNQTWNFKKALLNSQFASVRVSELRCSN